MFVDYSGERVPLVDLATGVVTEAEIFGAVLGASSLIYAEAAPWSLIRTGVGARLPEAHTMIPSMGAR